MLNGRLRIILGLALQRPRFSIIARSVTTFDMIKTHDWLNLSLYLLVWYAPVILKLNSILNVSHWLDKLNEILSRNITQNLRRN